MPGSEVHALQGRRDGTSIELVATPEGRTGLGGAIAGIARLTGCRSPGTVNRIEGRTVSLE